MWGRGREAEAWVLLAVVRLQATKYWYIHSRGNNFFRTFAKNLLILFAYLLTLKDLENTVFKTPNVYWTR